MTLKPCRVRICNRVGVLSDEDPSLMACPDNYACDGKLVLVNYPSKKKSEGGYLCSSGSTCKNGVKTPCPAGTYNLSYGGSKCHICPGGHFCMENTFRLTRFICPSGSYCPEGTQYERTTGIQSIPCPNGFVCPQGSHEPIVCPAGQTPNLSKTDCVPCPNGYFCLPSRSEAKVATPCPAGSKCPGPGNTHPQICQPGSYQPSEAQEACITCEAGFYCRDGGLTRKGPKCPAGMFCDAGSSSPQSMCAEGYYCPEGSYTQLPCPTGKFCQGEGLGEPSGDCWAGFFCKSMAISPKPTDSVTGYICPEGHYCTPGT